MPIPACEAAGRSTLPYRLPAGSISKLADGETDMPAPAVAGRIRKAFERGSGHGLLQLGAVELGSALSASLGFGREFGHLFMARYTAVPMLAEDWATIDLPVPEAELERLAAAAPPITGAEYLDAALLAALWRELQAAAREDIAATGGEVQAWLQGKHPSWSLVGRVCFHLAENKGDERSPFAFLATYASHVSREARVRHLPLGSALQAYSGAQDHAALLNLLLPVHKAAEQSPWLRSLVDTGQVFHPLAWTPSEAHRFLRSVPVLEASGVIVRIPDWWQAAAAAAAAGAGQSGPARRRPRGCRRCSTSRSNSRSTARRLSQQEWQQLMAAGDGLVRLKGRWVEVDGTSSTPCSRTGRASSSRPAAKVFPSSKGCACSPGPPSRPRRRRRWSRPRPSGRRWWRATGCAAPSRPCANPARAPDPQPEIRAQLRPYQRPGVHWLWWLNRLGLGGCLADDMGLGKTHPGAEPRCSLRQARRATPGPHLLVVPASLIANWQAEIGALRAAVCACSSRIRRPCRRANWRRSNRSACGAVDLVVHDLRQRWPALPWLARRAVVAGRARRGAGDQEPRRAADPRGQGAEEPRCASR